MVCDTKDNGGLGVLNLRTHNECLLLKNLHKFYNKADLPWVHLIWNQYYPQDRLPITGARRGSFWWRDSYICWKLTKAWPPQLLEMVILHSLLWLDVWDNHFLSVQWPHLFSFARNKYITVYQSFLNFSAQEQPKSFSIFLCLKKLS